MKILNFGNNSLFTSTQFRGVKDKMQKLLVSVRGPKEALAAAEGGAHIADVEYPASALGTPYPLNIFSVRNQLNEEGYKKVLVSTNIGEVQQIRASSCQAALGVSIAGAELIKFGLAEQSLESAIYLADNIVRTVKKLSSKSKKLYPAVFVDEDLTRFFNPLKHGLDLVKESKADGLLIDTFNKLIGKGLLDYFKLDDISNFVDKMHSIKKEAWIAGSITFDELPALWETGVDVICVRGAACSAGNKGRFGLVDKLIVEKLVETMHRT